MSWILELVEYIANTGFMLRSFTRLALSAQGISIRILQWLDGARTPPSTPRVCLKVLPLWQICCQIHWCFCQILILTGRNCQHNYEAFGSLTIWGYVTVRTLGTIVVKYPGDQMFDHFDKFAVRLVDVFAEFWFWQEATVKTITKHSAAWQYGEMWQ